MAEWDVVAQVQANDPWAVVGTSRAPDMAPVKSSIATNINRAMTRKPAGSFVEALEAGLQISTAGLLVRGKAPELGLAEGAPITQRVGAMLGQTAGDIPAMIGGAVLGGAAGSPTTVGAVVTAGAGAFALPAGMRSVLMDAYEKGEFTSFDDFWKRTMGILWDTAKGWVTGAATAGAGVGAKALLPSAAPVVVRSVAPTAAELTTMVTVGNALEGQLPKPQDFLDAAVVLGGLKASGAAATKLRTIYAQTGVKPGEIVNQAVQEPAVWQELLATENALPSRYAALVANGGLPVEAKVKPGQVLTEQQAATARAFQEQPFARVPQMPDEPARPTHLNYNYIETPDQVKQSLSRLSELYESQIQTQRRGTVGWEETFDQSAKVLGDLLSATPEQVRQFVERKPGTAAAAAELYARKELAVTAAEDLMRRRNEIAEKGPKATPEEVANFLVQVERTGQMVSGFLGARAEAGRALNILKNTAREGRAAETVARILEEYGGQGRTTELIAKLGEYADPKQMLKFSQESVKATTYEKLIEAWKAGLVSGLRTHEVNVLSNLVFAALRVPKQAVASAFGMLRTGEKVGLTESMALSIGMLKGAMDGLKVAAGVLRTGEGMDTSKVEQFRPAIEGQIGTVVRIPFRALSAEDAFFRSINERGEAYTLATRAALDEGISMLSPAFQVRVSEIVQNPTPKMLEAIQIAGDRFTFNAELLEKGKSFQNLVRTTHLEWLFPFIRTPANIFKETARMTPGLNLAVREWREDFAKGGVARDLALAEVLIGGAMMSTVFAGVFSGFITGGGTPEKDQRTVQRAAGWKPYAVKIGDSYYDGYIRMAPAGVLMGIAADSAEFWNYMTKDEHDKWARMLAYAFAQNVTNQTFMRGFTSIVNVIQDPERYGESYFEGLAGSLIPGAIGQSAAEIDPIVREVHGMAEAMRARIPYMRQGLMPKRDIFGEPIKSPEYLWLGSPFSVSPLSTDKVRTEAMKIGFAVGSLPKKMDVIPGIDMEKLDKIELTPEQRDVFASETGKLAHTILSPMVNAQGWDSIPPILKRQMYERAFSEARRFGALKSLAPEVRLESMQKALEKFRKELQQ